MALSDTYFVVCSGLLLAAGLDLAVRWIAFGRVESVAIDVAVFSCVFSAVKMLDALVLAEPSVSVWVWKFCLGLVPVFGLVILHGWLAQSLSEKIEDVFHSLLKALPATAEGKDFIDAQRPIAHYAIDVCLCAAKPGIKKRRERIMSALKAAHYRSVPCHALNRPQGLLSGWSVLHATRCHVHPAASVQKARTTLSWGRNMRRAVCSIFLSLPPGCMGMSVTQRCLCPQLIPVSPRERKDS